MDMDMDMNMSEEHRSTHTQDDAPSAAESPAPTGVFRFRVGDIRATAVTDGSSAFPATVVFGNPSPEDRERALRERGKPTDMVESSLTSIVVDTGRHRVLIDTGVGGLSPETGKLFENLGAAGIDRADIDTVILTHGHPDHIAGTIDETGRPAFPNARYVMRRGEWDFWTDEQVIARAMAGTLHDLGELDQFMGAWAQQYLPPIAGQLDLIEGEEGEEIVPGIYALPAPGHTSHHMALIIASGNEQLLNLVDVAINPLHLEEPEWHPAFDWDPQQALATRRRIYDQAAADNARILVYHFPFPGIGHVRKSARGWEWEPEEE